MNAAATMRLSHSAGTYSVRTPPTATAKSVTTISAADAPKKTDSFDAHEFVEAVIVITASCVLSPSSARKSVKKAVPKSFHSIEKDSTNSEPFGKSERREFVDDVKFFEALASMVDEYADAVEHRMQEIRDVRLFAKPRKSVRKSRHRYRNERLCGYDLANRDHAVSVTETGFGIDEVHL